MMMSESAGTGVGVVVEPGSLLATSKVMAEKAEEVDDLRRHLRDATFSTMLYGADGSVSGVKDRVEAVSGDYLVKLVEHFYGLSDELFDATVDALVADGDLGEAFELTLAIASWQGTDNDPILDEMIRRRNQALGISGEDLTTEQADELFDAVVADMVEQSGQPEAVVEVQVATVLARSLPDEGKDWLADKLVVVVSGEWFSSPDPLVMVGEVLDTDDKVAVRFFNQLGAQGTALLPTKATDSVHGRNDAVPQAQEAVSLFASSLAKTSRSGELSFTGDELIEAGTYRPGFSELALLFETDERFDDGFIVSAAAAETRRREHGPGTLDASQTGAVLLDVVADYGPETAGLLYETLGPDWQLLYRPSDPIQFPLGADHPMIRVHQQLAEHETHGPGLGAIVIWNAAAQPGAMAPYAAEYVQSYIVANPDILATITHTENQAILDEAGRQPSISLNEGHDIYTEYQAMLDEAGVSEGSTYGFERLVPHIARDDGWEPPTLTAEMGVAAVTAVYDSGYNNLVELEHQLVESSVDRAINQYEYVNVNYGQPTTLPSEPVPPPPPDPTKNGEYAWGVGTALGILSTGRRNSNLNAAKASDRSNQLKGELFSFSLGLVPTPAALTTNFITKTITGRIRSEATGHTNSSLFPTGNELNALYNILHEEQRENLDWTAIADSRIKDSPRRRDEGMTTDNWRQQYLYREYMQQPRDSIQTHLLEGSE